MKTSTLIGLLQRADPSGEGHVVVGNVDILSVYAEPAYYDGYAQRLIRDESSPYYNVVGAEFVNSGTKISVLTLPIEDAILEDPELPISNCGRYADSIERWRNEAREIRDELTK